MTTHRTYYLSRILGVRAKDADGKFIGKVADLLIETIHPNHQEEVERPHVIGIRLKSRGKVNLYSFGHFEMTKDHRKRVHVKAFKLQPIPEETSQKGLFLKEVILDKQIVDLNGRKLVRVNDVRLVNVTTGTYAIAVDVGIEGLLRRVGIVRTIRWTLHVLGLSIPSRFILWDDVEAIDFSNYNIKLSKTSSKLHTLHPSDLADIIEEMGKQTRASVFSALDEEKAADVLEELEPDTQIHIIESMPLEKAADVIEKMPANEAADLLDVLEEEKAELLLNEMEKESSEEVRELLEYGDNTVGSLMTTEVLAFNEFRTVDDVIREFRTKKPEMEELYNLFVTNNENELIASFSLRDLVVSDPQTTLSQIMDPNLVYLQDEQKIDEIAELMEKYDLLAVPVVDKDHHLQGMVVIDDVIEDLVNKRRTL